jgi:hypothetical protein
MKSRNVATIVSALLSVSLLASTSLAYGANDSSSIGTSHKLTKAPRVDSGSVGWVGVSGSLIGQSSGTVNPFATDEGCSGYFTTGNPVMMQCRDVAPDTFGEMIPIRQGYYNSPTDTGFGESKFVQYHGLDLHSVIVAINNGVQTVQGNQLIYDLTCPKGGECQQTVVLRVVASTSGSWTVSPGNVVNTPDKKTLGVVNAYCIMTPPVTLCPSWVNTTLAQY